MKLDPQINGIIFDLDGTLLDDVGLARDLPFLLAESYGIVVDPQKRAEIINKVLATLSGSSSKLALAKALLWIAKQYQIHWYQRLEFIERADKIYREQILKSELFPKTTETLQILKGHFKRIGIVSTTSMKEIRFRLQNRPEFLALFGDNIIGGDCVKKVKPDPEGLLILAERWHVPPNELVFIGDMALDIVAALRAGCIAVGVLCGQGTEAELKNVGAMHIIKNIAELPSLFL